MLQSIRERAQGWLAAVIVIIIIIPFALWGVNSYLQGVNRVVVAEVNGEELLLADFQRALADYRRQLQAAAGGQLDLNRLDEALVKRQALEQMIEGRLLDQALEKLGLRITDRQLAEVIRSFPAFQEDGQFSHSRYRNRLSALGMTEAEFERRMRRDLAREQLRQGVSETEMVTPRELNDWVRIEGQHRDFRYVVIDPAAFRAEVEVSDEDIERYYREHQAEFTEPERVRVAYIDLSLEELARQVKPDEAALREYFETHRGDYTLAEQRRLGYLLVRVPEDADEATVEQARALAQRLAREAADGADLEALAGRYADEQGLTVEGGDLGLVAREALPAPVADAAFSVGPGEVTPPVRTELGFQIVRVEEVRPGGAPSFEAVRDQVAADYRRDRAERAFSDLAEQLAEVAFEQPDSLEPAAEATGLEIHHSDDIPRSGGKGLFADRRVLEAAFSEPVLQGGENSQPIELGDDRIVVLRVEDHQPARARPLDEVRETVRERLVDQRARERAKAVGAELLAALRSGEGAETLVALHGLSWHEATDAGREAEQVNRAVLRAAFRLPRPNDGTPSYGMVTLGTGEVAVIELTAVRDPKPGEVEPERVDALRAALDGAYRRRAWEEYLAALRRDAEIRIHEQAL